MSYYVPQRHYYVYAIHTMLMVKLELKKQKFQK